MKRLVLVNVHGLKDLVPIQRPMLAAGGINHHHALCALMDMVRVGVMAIAIGGMENVC